MGILSRTPAMSRDDAIAQADNMTSKAVYFINNGKPKAAAKSFERGLAAIKPHLSSEEVRSMNSRVSGASGIGGCSDFGINDSVDYDMPLTPFGLRGLMDKLYYQDWQAQKIIDIPVDDMLRNSFEYTGIDDEDAQKLYKYQEKLNFYETLRQALKMERLYGGAVIMLGLRDSEDNTEEPVDISKIGPDDLRFVNAIERTFIGNMNIQTDPTLPFYGKPQFYEIQGHRVHVSRLLIFDGDPLTPINRINSMPNYYKNNDGFGYPLLARVVRELEHATGSRQAAMHLIQRASVMVFSGDLQSASAFKDANQNIDNLRTLMNNVSNYKAALINSQPGNQATFGTVAANFGSVPELIDSYQRVLCALSEVPATRLLGESPSGLGATGESDENNYFKFIGSKQVHGVKPKIDKFLDYLIPSTGVNVEVDDITVYFPPLHVPSAMEEAQVRQIDAQNIVALVAEGIISTEEGIEEMKQRNVLITDPKDFSAPDKPEDFDNSDLNETSDFNDSIDKIRGKKKDDSRTAS